MQQKNLVGTLSVLLVFTLQMAAQSVVASPAAGRSNTNQVYGAFWEEGSAQNTTLLLRNIGSTAASADVALYSPGGQQEQVVQVNVKGNSVSRLSLGDLVQSSDGSMHWGGLAVQSRRAMQGQLVIADAQNGGVRYVPLQAGDSFDTENALHASWWLPDEGSEGQIQLFNASSQTITVTTSVVTDGTSGKEQAGAAIVLAPFASAKLDLVRDLLSKNKNTATAVMGSLVLRYSGAAHALQPFISIANHATGFLLQPVFQAKHDGTLAAGSTAWQFPAISLIDTSQVGAEIGESMTAYALLSNATNAPMQPELTAYFSEAGAQAASRATLPVTRLEPGEVRLVNLSQFIGQGGGMIPAGLTHMALTISHGGAPGDLGVTVLTANQAMSVARMSAGAIRPSGETDTSFWDVSVRPAILPTMKNPSEGQAGSVAQPVLYYADAWGIGTYDLPEVSVASERSLGLRLAMLSGVPDDNGNKIPSTTMFGLVSIRPMPTKNGNDASIETALAGADSNGSHPVSPSPGQSSTANASSSKVILAPHVAQEVTAAPACSPPPATSCHANVKSFMDAHQAAAAAVASQLNVSVQDILGLSGQETGWGTSPISVNDNNFFGQHAGAPGESGTATTSGGVQVAVFTSFAASAQSFATAFGSLVQGKSDPSTFAQALVPKFNSGKAPGGNPNFVSTVKGAIQSVINCQ